jgi:hypothetical protein
MEIILKIVLIGFLVIFTVVFVFSLVIFAVHHKTGGALFVPIPKVMIQKIIDSIDFSWFHDIRELGTGDGRFLSAVERTYKRAVVGYEINPIAYGITWLRIRLLGLDSRVEFKNFWEQDLRPAQCIYCYLFPDIMSRLGEKLDGELAEGSWVISANYPIPEWSEESVLHVDNSMFNDPIYVYLIATHKKRNVQESKH